MASFLLDASPDFRQQQLKFKFDFDYLFISHRHFDHVQGLEELRQDFVVGKPMAEKKRRYFIVGKRLSRWLRNGGARKVWEESTQEAYLDLLKSPFFEELILSPYEEKILDEDRQVSVTLIKGIHATATRIGDTCNGLVIKEGGVVLVYLADIQGLNDKLFHFLVTLNPEFIIAHAAFFNRLLHVVHWGVGDIKKLPGKKILLSHFSHRVGRTHKELVEQAKEIDPRFIVACDGMKMGL